MKLTGCMNEKCFVPSTLYTHNRHNHLFAFHPTDSSPKLDLKACRFLPQYTTQYPFGSGIETAVQVDDSPQCGSTSRIENIFELHNFANLSIYVMAT